MLLPSGHFSRLSLCPDAERACPFCRLMRCTLHTGILTAYLASTSSSAADATTASQQAAGWHGHRQCKHAAARRPPASAADGHVCCADDGVGSGRGAAEAAERLQRREADRGAHRGRAGGHHQECEEADDPAAPQNQSRCGADLLLIRWRATHTGKGSKDLTYRCRSSLAMENYLRPIEYCMPHER